MAGLLEKYFKLEKHETSIKQEIVAGTTTFLTMAYIIFVNPDILSSTGMDKGALITVTILAAFAGTILAGLWANVPFAMAPGMGLNAFFAFSLVLGKQINWQTALGVVFISGVLFLLLTLTGVRKWIVSAIPPEIRLATAAGIGLFITFIGFKSLGFIVDNPATLVGLGKLTTPVILGLAGLILIGVLEVLKIKGSILLGIITITVVGMITGDVSMPEKFISLPPSPAPILFKLDIMGALKWSLWGAVFSFIFVDLFDSLGTILACSYEAKLVNEDGSVEKIDKVLEADAVATIAGALLGTSTTTTYIESGSGIAEGGRTGLTSVVTAFLFMLALLFTPFIGIVPAFATAPALIIVGIFMFKNVKLIDFGNFETGFPAFLTIILMPLTYSISMGLAVGFVSYCILGLFAGKIKEIHPLMWGIGIFSFVDIILNTI
ncbi:MAG: guanine permease [Deltaproteobacteria bacterium]|nr:MAG: guanine permease [Deltaproteobacteria bacterium]